MRSDITEQSLPALFMPHNRSIAAPDRASVVNSTTDEDLLIRLESGDLSAVGPLFDKYAPIVFRIGLRTLHDTNEAEDLVQDVFFHLCQKAKGFDAGRGTARTWIVQIAYRRAFDRHAYLNRWKIHDGTDVEFLTNKEMMGSVTAIENGVAVDELTAAFADLNEKQRSTLEMFFLRVSISARSAIA